uniref:Uncharacterized protein n=1 Tax=Panagrolaimus sp. PS1159 TaxID=55785 RepID=A0AC35G6U9_9BILA
MSSSTLIPYGTSAFSDALPILFLEARVHGNTHQLITQMGVSIDADQCSVGMLTRVHGNTHQLITQMGVSIDADQCSVGMLINEKVSHFV